MTTDKTSSPKPVTTSAVAPPTAAQEAIATLNEAEKVLHAEAGFHGQPGSPIYDNFIRLAERCRKAAAVLRSAG